MRIIFIKAMTLLLLLLVMPACTSGERVAGDEEYAVQISEWDSLRLERLKSPTGWVNLAGLFWLHEGDNTIGSHPANDHSFPRGPNTIGVLNLSGGEVFFAPSGETAVLADGEPAGDRIKIFGRSRDAELITVDSLGFFIIQRGERYGIRLRDYIHPRLEALKSIERYTPDRNWIVEARFIDPEEEITINVPDVLGEVSTEISPGILEFELEGATHRLYPTGSRDQLFVIFADDTNALETYGGGRFLSAPGPDENGIVYLDFNKAYNPPCAFSPYATCPLPPRENFLTFPVNAGEKAVAY